MDKLSRLRQNQKIICLIILLSFLGSNTLWQIWISRSAYKNNSVVMNIAPPNPVKYRYQTGFIRSNFVIDTRSLEALKKADVLIVGSSLCVFAFHSNQFYDFFKNHGMEFYNLCIPGTNIKLSEEIFKKFDLHPDLVILFYDYVSFNQHYPLKEKNRLEDWSPFNWNDFNIAFTYESSLYTRYLINLVSPYMREYFREKKGISFGGPATQAYIFRTWNGSSYQIYCGEWDILPLKMTVADDIEASHFNKESEDIARQYKNELESRGTRLVIAPLDFNSAGELNYGNAKRWAEILNIPIIIPRTRDLPVFINTLHGNHLYEKGTRQITNAYIEMIEESILDKNGLSIGNE